MNSFVESNILQFNIKVNGFTKINEVDYYRIEINNNDSKKEVLRRYNHLYVLNEKLSNKFTNLPPFPPSLVYLLKPSPEQRVLDFQIYFSSICLNPDLFHSQELRQFFELCYYFLLVYFFNFV